MNAAQEPGQDILSSAGELLELLRQHVGSHRPDLIRRLLRAQHTLDTAHADQPEAAVRQVAGEALRALDSLAVDLRARRAALGDEGRTGRLRAELAGLRARFEQFTQASREWPHLMAHDFAKIGSDLEFELRTRLRTLVSESELAIEATDPARGRDQLDAQLRDRLVTEARLSYQRLDVEVNAVAANLAGYLSLRPQFRVSPPPAAAEALVAELPDAYRPSPTRPLPARLVTAMMPGYSGIVITLLVTRLLGVQLPGWMIAGCALVAALALGGAKASGERKRQLDRRRADASKAVRMTVDEFRFALTKQVRDALLALQLDVRRALTLAVTEQNRAMTDEIDRVKVAVETGRRPAELAAIARDLESIAELRERALELRLATSEPELWSARGPNLIVVA